MSFFGFGQSVDVDILLNDADSRKRAEHKTEDGKKDKYTSYSTTGRRCPGR